MDIYKICPKCIGEGSYYRDNPNGQIFIDPCPQCGGDKYIRIAELDFRKQKKRTEDLAAKVDDILDKCNDIFEKVSE